MRDELNTIGTRPQDPYYISEEDKKIMREEIFPFWEGKSLAEACEKELRKEGLWEYGAEAAITDLTYHVTSGGGDSSPGYDIILFRKGIHGILKEAEAHLESLQAVWTIQSLFSIEENQCSTSLGCVDQYMYPCYAKDIAEGILTPQEAFELTGCFLIKCSEVIWYTPKATATYFAGYMPFINMCVGGLKRDGGAVLYEGPTAIIKSVSKINEESMSLGMTHNFKFSEGFLTQPQGRASLKTLLKTSSAMGNGEMQFICVENDTLRKAQKKPEEYRDLIVRVAGYCAYFVELCEEVQNEIISRTMLGE